MPVVKSLRYKERNLTAGQMQTEEARPQANLASVHPNGFMYNHRQ